MAKAKTPSTGNDKPAQNATSRGAVEADKPETAAKTPAKAPKAETNSDPKTETKAPAPSVMPKVKKDATPAVETAKTDSKTEQAKPAVTADKPATAKADTPVASAEKKPEPPKNTPDQKPAETPAKPSVASTSPAQSAKTEPQKSGSVFFPMLLGGIVAGAIGFAAAELDWLGLRNDTPEQSALSTGLSEQEARIATLEKTIAELGPMPDTSAIETALSDVTDSISALSTRVDDIANRPVSENGQAPQIDTSGFEAELAELKSSVEKQRDEIQTLLDNALSVEEATAQAAQVAAAQTAIAKIVAAITTGQPFAAEIAELEENGGQDVPAALSVAAEDGVVTSASLQDRFPDAARAALSAARASAPSDAGGGFGSFLKNQLGARSVTPREGNDPDAVLSRAEAAMRDGRLADALAEVQALPEGAKAPMADWIADAQTRLDALDAVDTLTQRLTAN